MTVFASGGKARTFDYRAGDVGYAPFAMGHDIEDTGTTRPRFLEALKSARFQDTSLKRWTALTPTERVRQHLRVDLGLPASVPTERTPVMPGASINPQAKGIGQ